MIAIIMAGGEGTRLKSVTGDLPKPMVQLCGKPVLEHILNLLKRNGITEAVLTLRYRSEVIKDYFGDGEKFGMKLHYHVETEPLGTAGGVKACREFYGDRDFLVISGDSACDFNLKALMEAHHRHSPAVTMALYAHTAPLQYGIVLTDTRERVVSFIEKPRWEKVVSDLVNTGIYVVSPAAMGYVPDDRPYDFAKDLFPKLMEAGHEIRGIAMDGYWCDIGTPRAYYQCCLDALDGKLHLDDMPEPEIPHPGYVKRPDAGVQRDLHCRNRARLMRVLSMSLMEAGADFSDGITLQGTLGKVKIRSRDDAERITISASATDPSHSAELCGNFESMIKNLEETLNRI